MKKLFYLPFLIFCLSFTQNLAFSQSHQIDRVFDGPHIFSSNDYLTIKYYDDGIINTYMIGKKDTTIFRGFLHDSTAMYTIPSQFQSPPEIVSEPEKLFVVSDIHGQYGIFRKLLCNNGIIDQNNSWMWGNGHLVILGDVFDRGSEVHETLWLIYKLEQQAQEVGGVVHFIQGNHEVMILQNDLRYVHDKYFAIAGAFAISIPELYGENTFWGNWLRSKNIFIQIGSLLFVHGGIHPELISHYKSISDINKIMKTNLDTNQDEIKNNPSLSLLFGSNGPVWYRGFFYPDSLPDVSDDELASILNHFNVDKIIVGHTTEDHIYTSHNGRIICVDGGIKDGIRGEGLIIINGIYYRVDTAGQKELLFK